MTTRKPRPRPAVEIAGRASRRSSAGTSCGSAATRPSAPSPGRRTCIVVSNDIANRFGQAITVIPTQAYSAERAERAYMTDLRRPRSTLPDDRVVNASMVMTYDRTRVARRAGKVTPQTLEDIDRALAMHLALVRAGAPQPPRSSWR